MSGCVATCKAPAGAQAHCSLCHLTFSRVSGFDRHRRHNSCLDPVALGMAPDQRGVWRFPGPQDDRPPNWRRTP